MKSLKKIFNLLLCVSLVIANLMSCSKNNNNTLDKANKDKIKIVATIFPIYDMVRNIVPSDKYDITLLLDSGLDIHNFQPTAKDIITIGSADLFIHIGGESDKWVEKTIITSANDKLITLNLMENLSHLVKEEELVEGMEHEHEEEHEEHEEEHDDHDEDHEHEHEMDEHIWLSIRNAKEMVEVIKNQILKIDNTNASIINENAKTFKNKLDELDKKYVDVVNKKTYDTILFGDRFPFRYMFDDYGINYYAAFSGCSAESEASFETVAFLARKVDELNLKHVCAITGVTHRIAQTVINTTNNKNQDIIYFSSMEGITNIEDASNVNYISIMEDNLKSLEKALN